MKPQQRRKGVSLFETIVVMGVLVMSAALVYPSLRGMYGSYKIQGAVDSVRAAWALARARAIEEGQPYRFAVDPSGQHFRIAPDREELWSGPSQTGGAQAGVLEQAMPVGVRFSINGEVGATPSEDISSTREAQTPPSGTWNKAIIFQADGTAKEDVRMLFQARGVRSTQLQFRGLTGSVTMQYMNN